MADRDGKIGSCLTEPRAGQSEAMTSAVRFSPTRAQNWPMTEFGSGYGARRTSTHRQGSRAHNGVGVSQAIVDGRTGQAVGLVILSLRPQPGVGGLGYWVVPSARGSGVATSAVRCLRRPGVLADSCLSHLRLPVMPPRSGSSAPRTTCGRFQWLPGCRPTSGVVAVLCPMVSHGRQPLRASASCRHLRRT